MSDAFTRYMLQRIAEGIENGDAGGGSLTVDVTGAGDMQGCDAGTAGVHGLVPAPAAGDQDKYLSGGGTWEDIPSGGGGVDYSYTEQDTGLKWVDGRSIYQKSFTFSTPANNGYTSLATDISDSYDVIDYKAIVTSSVGGVTFLGKDEPYHDPPYGDCGLYFIPAASGGVWNFDYRAATYSQSGTAYLTVYYVK